MDCDGAKLAEFWYGRMAVGEKVVARECRGYLIRPFVATLKLRGSISHRFCLFCPGAPFIPRDVQKYTKNATITRYLKIEFHVRRIFLSLKSCVVFLFFFFVDRVFRSGTRGRRQK